MGITIHYRFAVTGKDVAISMLDEAREIAKKLNFELRDASETEIYISPHSQSETINLKFEQYKHVKEKAKKEWSYALETLKDFDKVINDNDFVCSSFTKTQYAGYKVHVLVAELLRKIASRCTLAYVSDEADYYEYRNIRKTAESFDESSEMISKVTGMLKEAFGSENVYCAIDNTEKV